MAAYAKPIALRREAFDALLGYENSPTHRSGEILYTPHTIDIFGFAKVNIGRNSVYNFFGAIIPAVIALLTVPFYLKIIGIDKFGALTLTWIISGTFGFFDLGLTRASTFRIAESQSAPERREVLGTSIALASLSGLIAIPTVWIACSLYVSHAISATDQFSSEFSDAIWAVALLIPVNLISSIFIGSLQGKGKFLSSNAISISNSLAIQAIPLLVAVAVSREFSDLVISILVSRFLIMVVAAFVVANKVTSGWNWATSRIEAGRMMAFGKWVMASSILGPILLYADRFILGSTLGPAAIALYSIPFQFAQRISIIPNAVGTAAFPALTSMDENEASKQVEKMYLKILIFSLTTVLFCGLFSDFFFKIWLGNNYSIAVSEVFFILSIAFSVNCFAVVLHSYISSRGSPATITRSMLIEIAPYLLLLSFLSTQLGVTGAAWAFLTLCACDVAILAALTRNRPNTLRYACGFLMGAAVIYAARYALLSGMP